MTQERWLRVYPDGTLVLHLENDGAAFLRYGADAVERTISRDELRASYPSLFEQLERSGGRDTSSVFFVR
jgi:hypothetical protein